jgi:hypothetical protein
MAFSDNSSATAARWRRRCRGNRDRTWRHGSRFLLSIAGACAAAAIVLRLAASFEMAKAGGLWTDYGLMLMVAAAIFCGSRSVQELRRAAKHENRPNRG